MKRKINWTSFDYLSPTDETPLSHMTDDEYIDHICKYSDKVLVEAEDDLP